MCVAGCVGMCVTVRIVDVNAAACVAGVRVAACVCSANVGESACYIPGRPSLTLHQLQSESSAGPTHMCSEARRVSYSSRRHADCSASDLCETPSPLPPSASRARGLVCEA
eukprot:1389184-Pyramimonas_sp.AAC.1